MNIDVAFNSLYLNGYNSLIIARRVHERFKIYFDFQTKYLSKVLNRSIAVSVNETTV